MAGLRGSGFDPTDEEVDALMRAKARAQGVSLGSRKAGVRDGRVVNQSVQVLRAKQRYADDADPEPTRITCALDLGGFYGPQVDEACDAHEPDVDQWETGELVPMREQIDKLAALTGFAPWWFYGPPLDGLGNIFICSMEDAS